MNSLGLTIFLAFVACLGMFFSFIGFLYISRGNPVERTRTIGEDKQPDVADPAFLKQFQAHTNTAIDTGNTVEILFNGEQVYPRLWEDLEAATTLITWHVFWFKPGELADRVLRVLSERARAGVKVLFLYDRFGAMGVEDEYFAKLKDAGVEVYCFRPLTWHTLYKWQQRSHARFVIIDGQIGYTGGFAIEDAWQGDGLHEDQWRDTSVRLRGPAVHQLQAAFAADWAEATGQLLVGDTVFPPAVPEEEGPHHAGVMYGAPSIGSTDVERYYALTICGACETLYITNPYFIPDDDFRHLLAQAVERGVDVRVLTPGENTDKKSTWYAGRCHYEEILQDGIRIYEYRPTMVHAKTIVADGIWCAVGTVNFDNRSMSLNDEVMLLAHEPELADRLHSQFVKDLEHADELDLEEFRKRGVWEKAKEGFWVMFSRFL